MLTMHPSTAMPETTIASNTRTDRSIDTPLMEALDKELADSTTARVFGEMARRAVPHIDRYHSDLYRDAQTIEPLIREWILEGGRLTFNYRVGACGTHIDQPHENLTYSDIRRAWRFDLVRVRTEWRTEVRLQISPL